MSFSWSQIIKNPFDLSLESFDNLLDVISKTSNEGINKLDNMHQTILEYVISYLFMMLEDTRFGDVLNKPYLHDIYVKYISIILSKKTQNFIKCNRNFIYPFHMTYTWHFINNRNNKNARFLENYIFYLFLNNDYKNDFLRHNCNNLTLIDLMKIDRKKYFEIFYHDRYIMLKNHFRRHLPLSQLIFSQISLN